MERCISDLDTAKVGRWVILNDVIESGVKPISSRFVFQEKKRPGNKREAFCRWTPRGFEEEAGTHYDPFRIFAATPQLWCLRYILVTALVNGQETFHFDFKRAFSHADLDENVVVTMPKGFAVYNKNGDEMCLELYKSSEGLKQSAANWQRRLMNKLKQLGYQNNVKEPCLWASSDKRVSFCIHVDDMYGTFAKGSRSVVDTLFKSLDGSDDEHVAPCKDLGEISFALGIEIEWARDRSSVSISCKKKIEALLKSSQVLSGKTNSVPIRPNSKMHGTEDDPGDLDGEELNQTEKTRYQSGVGSILYISRAARADLCYAAWYLACGMSRPTEKMKKQLHQCLRYMMATIDRKMTYSLDEKNSLLDLSDIGYNPRKLCFFCDSNHRSSKSTMCSVAMLCNAAVFWQVKQQKRVSLSSVEAELAALSSATQDTICATEMLNFVGLKVDKPVDVFCDSQGAIANAKNSFFSERLRHVDNQIFFVRESEDIGEIATSHVSGTSNPADIGTKPLGKDAFTTLEDFISGRWVPKEQNPAKAISDCSGAVSHTSLASFVTNSYFVTTTGKRSGRDRYPTLRERKFCLTAKSNVLQVPLQRLLKESKPRRPRR